MTLAIDVPNQLARTVFKSLGCVVIAVLFSLQTGCSTQAIQTDPIPKHDEFVVDSKSTGEKRKINVYVPPSYSDGETKYPVVYMPDGGIKEDFPHIANTLNSMIEKHLIAPVILVGVENTNRKRDLTGKTDSEDDKKLLPDHNGSDNFRTFFRDELRPEIEKRYRCNGETAIVGESLAGLFVVETLIVEPKLFDRYIAFDPSLWWNDAKLVAKAENAVATEPFSKIIFWFASSGTADIVPPVKKLEGVLKSNAADQMTWKYTPCPKEEHSTIFRAKKEDAFEWSLWKPTSK